MADGFNRNEVSNLLVKCHRRCCICHRFCGVKIETHHIEQPDKGGTHHIDNAIPVCFECHAEVQSYNDNHPRGRKYLPDELREHKRQWLHICETRPDIFTEAARVVEVGPLQALIDELEFNLHVASDFDANAVPVQNLGCTFYDVQFQRAMQFGVISILEKELKTSILEAYRATRNASHYISVAFGMPDHIFTGQMVIKAYTEVQNATPKIKIALKMLLKFLSSEDENQ